MTRNIPAILLIVALLCVAVPYPVPSFGAANQAVKTAGSSSDSAKKNAAVVRQKNIRPDPFVAVVLGGGGARGAAHIGVLSVLEENKLKPDMIVGNSMGAIIGSLYCAGVPLDEIERLCLNGEVKKAFAPNRIPVQLVKKALKPRVPFVGKKKYSGLFRGDDLEEFIKDQVGKKYPTLESLPIPLAVTVVNLLDGKAYRMTKGDLPRLVRASCSLPPLLKPIEHENMLLADGGIRSNLPTYAARDLGADVVIAVNVDEKLQTVDKSDMYTFTGLANRVATIVLAVRDEQFSREADLVIQPDVSGISIISDKNDDYHKAVVAGREAAQQALPDLKKMFGVQTAGRKDPSKTIR